MSNAERDHIAELARKRDIERWVENMERLRTRHRRGCQCGDDLPGQCPGADQCPYADSDDEDGDA